MQVAVHFLSQHFTQKNFANKDFPKKVTDHTFVLTNKWQSYCVRTLVKVLHQHKLLSKYLVIMSAVMNI